MEHRYIEIKDRATRILALALRIPAAHKVPARDPAVTAFLDSAGYGIEADYILLIRIDGGEITGNCDPWKWHDRTMNTAHAYLSEEWNFMGGLSQPIVVDVEYILGETSDPKRSDFKRSGEPARVDIMNGGE